VHGQRRHTDVRLVTVRTGARVATVETAVGLLVTRQVGRRGVVSTALRARVPTARPPFHGRRRYGVDVEPGRRLVLLVTLRSFGGLTPSGTAVGRDERLVRVADGDAELEVGPSDYW